MKKFISRTIGAVKLYSKANAPTLFVGGGVLAMGAGAVLACRSTLQVETVIRPHTESLGSIEEAEKNLKAGRYSADAARSDRLMVYSRATFDLGKLYFVPGVLFVSGACLVFKGHSIMMKRNATLAIAYTTLQKSYDAYRARVVDNFGPEADQAMMNGWVSKEIVEADGTTVKTITSRDWDGPLGDPYARIFEQGATKEWQNDLGVNKMHIHNQERMANVLVNTRGYLYLSEVYKSLGFPETDLSRVVGWKARVNPDGSKEIVHISFGLDKPMADDWKYNKEKAVYLDFNCQGLIIGGKIQKILEQA